MPDRVIYKACGNRRSAACPSCAETYRRDAYHVIRAGLIGGKGVPETVTAHPAVFATFTAPSFGPVHTRPIRRHTCTDRARCACRPEPCHARRDAATCEHGQPLACFTRHERGDPSIGQPLCPDCYDYDTHAVWNHAAGELWRRTKQAIERQLAHLARRRGLPFVPIPDGNGRPRWVPRSGFPTARPPNSRPAEPSTSTSCCAWTASTPATRTPSSRHPPESPPLTWMTPSTTPRGHRVHYPTAPGPP